MHRRAWAVVALAAMLVFSGLAPHAAATSATQETEDPPSPDEDVIGWECGYWHNQSIAVDQGDGLTEDELDAFVCRSMARVETIREREFTENVSVSVISRDEYRDLTANRTPNDSFAAWNNQVWKALFIVGDDADVHDELRTVSGETTAGFYSFADNEIKIVTDTPERPVIDNATLVHELAHALQDQHFNLSKPAFQRDTQDGQLARDGLIEGEANYIEQIYVERCKEEWECVHTPSQTRSAGSDPINFGIFLTVFHPYSDGPAYINALVQRDGWSAVNAAYEDPPVSTKQIIHIIDEPPPEMEYEHTANNGWEPFAEHGVGGADTAGEASMYAMFWYQAREYGADTIEVRNVLEETDQYSVYNYHGGPSAGWVNDKIVPYRNTNGPEPKYGYVWVTKWETTEDAEQFRTSYLRILNADAHNARQVRESTWIIDNGPYANAYRVVRNEKRVTIVHGPTMQSLSELRPGIEDQPIEDPPTPRTPTATIEPRTMDPPTQATSPGTTAPGQPGFGLVVTVIALVLVGLASRYR